jgi:hypothetical protein
MHHSLPLPLVKTTHHHGVKHQLASSTGIPSSSIAAHRQASQDAIEERVLGLPREENTL